MKGPLLHYDDFYSIASRAFKTSSPICCVESLPPKSAVLAPPSNAFLTASSTN